MPRSVTSGAGRPREAAQRAGEIDGAELIATVSHELRQPLASIRGYAEMLVAHWRDFQDAEKLLMLKELLHDALRVGELVDELVVASREGGRLPPKLRPTDIVSVVEAVLTKTSGLYPGLAACTELAGEIPPVSVDPFKIEQVLTNIVHNACTHGAARSLVVRLSRSGVNAVEMVEVAVADDGVGIPPSELAHVTEKFFRGTEPPANGLGLGLWISKAIVEAHGGELEVSSSVGKGTTVRFTVLVDKAQNLDQNGLAGNERRPGAGSGKLAAS
ncbi:MAG TPA: HAMP domain-containing sensor histidine kinase [Acidimicrobiales bacterium]|nr:HAMP domain-containing sensor histidine kinase [Acidimicrobiales bacterium]